MGVRKSLSVIFSKLNFYQSGQRVVVVVVGDMYHS